MVTKKLHVEDCAPTYRSVLDALLCIKGPRRNMPGTHTLRTEIPFPCPNALEMHVEENRHPDLAVDPAATRLRDDAQ
jgi:hypothetical protein